MMTVLSAPKSLVLAFLPLHSELHAYCPLCCPNFDVRTGCALVWMFWWDAADAMFELLLAEEAAKDKKEGKKLKAKKQRKKKK